jgi:hypothetical protein
MEILINDNYLITLNIINMKSKFRFAGNTLLLVCTILFLFNACSSSKKTHKGETQIADWIIISDKELSTKDITDLETEIRNFIINGYKLEGQNIKISFYKNVESELVSEVVVDAAASTITVRPVPPRPHYPGVEFFDRGTFDKSKFNINTSLSNGY